MKGYKKTMINIKKVTNDIKTNGKYDAILEHIKDKLKNENPSLEEIEKLIIEDKYYVTEYKDLNRWGELTSVHIKPLEIKKNDSAEAKDAKQKINGKIDYLVLGEEYEVPSKKVIYAAWTGFLLLPSIYVIDNMVRMFTTWYITHSEYVYLSFFVVFILCIWGYFKVVGNHTRQHEQYIQTQTEIRDIVKMGLKKGYFSHNEIYKN